MVSVNNNILIMVFVSILIFIVLFVYNPIEKFSSNPLGFTHSDRIEDFNRRKQMEIPTGTYQKYCDSTINSYNRYKKTLNVTCNNIDLEINTRLCDSNNIDYKDGKLICTTN